MPCTYLLRSRPEIIVHAQINISRQHSSNYSALFAHGNVDVFSSRPAAHPALSSRLHGLSGLYFVIVCAHLTAWPTRYIRADRLIADPIAKFR